MYTVSDMLSRNKILISGKWIQLYKIVQVSSTGTL